MAGRGAGRAGGGNDALTGSGRRGLAIGAADGVRDATTLWGLRRREEAAVLWDVDEPPVLSVLNTASTAFLTNTTAFVSAPAGTQPDQQGGGVWGRTIGGSVENKNTGVTTVDTTALGFATPGSVNCNTTTRQDYAGFQVGHDISILNHGGSGANWHAGVTAGYFESFAHDTTAGGTFKGDFQVPFAGVYTAFTQGNLFLDGQARWDFYQNSVSDTANGIFN